MGQPTAPEKDQQQTDKEAKENADITNNQEKEGEANKNKHPDDLDVGDKVLIKHHKTGRSTSGSARTKTGQTHTSYEMTQVKFS